MDEALPLLYAHLLERVAAAQLPMASLLWPRAAESYGAPWRGVQRRTLQALSRRGVAVCLDAATRELAPLAEAVVVGRRVARDERFATIRHTLAMQRERRCLWEAPRDLHAALIAAGVGLSCADPGLICKWLGESSAEGGSSVWGRELAREVLVLVLDDDPEAPPVAGSQGVARIPCGADPGRGSRVARIPCGAGPVWGGSPSHPATRLIPLHRLSAPPSPLPHFCRRHL